MGQKLIPSVRSLHSYYLPALQHHCSLSSPQPPKMNGPIAKKGKGELEAHISVPNGGILLDSR